MQLTDEQVRKMATLARLGLSDEEVKKFAKELSDVFEYAQMLREVETDDVEPIAQITGLQDVFFDDEVEDCQVILDLLNQSPQDVKENMIRVKRIL